MTSIVAEPVGGAAALMTNQKPSFLQTRSSSFSHGSYKDLKQQICVFPSLASGELKKKNKVQYGKFICYFCLVENVELD